MNEVAFDKMIHTEHERYLQIEKEYIRYKPVRNERKVYDDYKSKSIKRGALKSLLQWEEQVRSDYAAYSIEWRAGTVKVLDYHKKTAKKNLCFTLAVFFPVFATILAALVLYGQIAFSVLGMCVNLELGLGILLVLGTFITFSGIYGVFNKILFYEEFARILREM